MKFLFLGFLKNFSKFILELFGFLKTYKIKKIKFLSRVDVAADMVAE